MNFLAPWFLLGALAVAGPVVFHLIRRSVRERMPFSSVLFLRPTPPRATRRRKLEHLVLLALRCLAILLLAAGFARPFLPQHNPLPPATDAGRQTIILVDLSASMRREGLWPKARAVAERYLKEAALVDRVGVVGFDRQPHTIVSLIDWSAWPADRRAVLAQERLAALSPGWGGTHLGLALTTAAEQFSDEPGRTGVQGPRDVVLISDLQEGAGLDGLQGHDWPKGVRVIIERVDAKRKGNAGLQILEAPLAGGGDGRLARVRVINTRDSDQERFQLGWQAEVGTPLAVKPAEIYLAPGQTRAFPAPELPPGAATGALRLTGDGEDFDNIAWFAAPEQEGLTIAYFGSESGNDPEHMRYYLERSFPETPRRRVEVTSARSNAVFSLETLNRAALAVIPGSLAGDEAVGVREWITGGKTALLVLTNAQCGATLASLAGMADPEISEGSGDYALFGEIDFSHPLLAPFADPRFSDFSHIHFWKHRRWTIPPGLAARVLARFDDRSPALAQLTVGKGNLLVLGAGWNPADSQLAVSSKFLPLLQTILDWTGDAAPARSQYQIGDSLPSPVSRGTAVQWRRPDGKIALVAAGSPFSETDIPGIYTATADTRTRRFAVNLPAEESRTAPLSPDDLGRLGVPMQSAEAVPLAQSPETRRRFQEEELESRQKLWRWFVAGILAVALVEVVLGGWLARRVKTLEVVP